MSDHRFKDAAALVASGYAPIPIIPGTKRPNLDEWPTYQFKEGDAAKYADHGIGIVTRRTPAIDIDVYDAEAVAEIKAMMLEILEGEVPPERIGLAPKRLFLFKTDKPFSKKQTEKYLLEGCEKPSRVEILGDGQQFVAFGIHPDTKKPYVWNSSGDPFSVSAASLPLLTEELAKKIIAQSQIILERHSKLGELRSALKVLPADDYSDWIRYGMACHATSYGAEAFTIWDEWSRTSGKYKISETAEKWKTFSSDGPRTVTAKSIYAVAKSAGWVTQKQTEFRDQASYNISDDAIALAFAVTKIDELRFVAAFGRWYHYDGKKWAEDDTLLVTDFVRAICRQKSAGLDTPKSSSAVASAKTIAAVERLARSDRRLSANIEQWDADHWLLNTPDGVIDLKTGAIRKHRPQDYFTKITAVSPSGDCPLFRGFLSRITDDNTDLQAFIARMLGYALTGSTKEHALFFLYGTGANGKSVLLNTVSNILADYAQTAPIETFTASQFERHPTELAGLRGARLVIAIETEEGRAWAEAKIKQLTGGDPISARFMRQDFFEYNPAFKLMIAGNHKPSLRSVDEAIRRRFHLVPFP